MGSRVIARPMRIRSRTIGRSYKEALRRKSSVERIALGDAESLPAVRRSQLATVASGGRAMM